LGTLTPRGYRAQGFFQHYKKYGKNFQHAQNIGVFFPTIQILLGSTSASFLGHLQKNVEKNEKSFSA